MGARALDHDVPEFSRFPAPEAHRAVENALRVHQGPGAARGEEANLGDHYLLSGSGLAGGCAGKPGKEKPANMLRAWFCIWSWNCENTFWLCSM